MVASMPSESQQALNRLTPFSSIGSDPITASMTTSVGAANMILMELLSGKAVAFSDASCTMSSKADPRNRRASTQRAPATAKSRSRQSSSQPITTHLPD